MLDRALAIPLHRAVQEGVPVLVQGPRGAGKSTLLRREFPAHTYVSLDEAVHRARAREDPGRFLARLRGAAVIDDLHRAPELVAYLGGTNEVGRLVLASSRRLALPCPTFELHAPTRAELERRPAVALETLGRFAPEFAASRPAYASWRAEDRLPEADIRDLVSVQEMDRFERFVAAARSRSGTVLDQQSIARDSGVAHRTVARWLAALDACFLTLRLPPGDVDFGRRLVRSPKLHFLKSGCFESQVVSEVYRNACHAGTVPDLRYWRDSNGLEVPLLIRLDTATPVPVGISAESDALAEARLRRWLEIAGVKQGALITASSASVRKSGILRYSLTQL